MPGDAKYTTRSISKEDISLAELNTRTVLDFERRVHVNPGRQDPWDTEYVGWITAEGIHKCSNYAFETENE